MVPKQVARSGRLVLERGPRIISLVLALLTCMWLSAVQVNKFLKNCGIFEACDLGWICSDKVESSTYFTMEQPTDRSLMRTKKDKGPNQEPWSIPAMSGFHVDKHWLERTLCWRSDRYEPNHKLSSLLGKPYCFNLSKSTLIVVDQIKCFLKVNKHSTDWASAV